MDNDDRIIGRILGRRDALRLLAGGGAAAALAPALPFGWRQPALAAGLDTLPACVVQPELTEGPYFVDLRLNRSDIRGEPGSSEMRPGVPLALAFTVSSVGAGGCTPLPGATVDVWQCDALGVYSGVSDPGFGDSSRAQAFLRGYQTTGEDGRAAFTTIYPGWYRGRAVHVHFKVRTMTPAGEAYEFTSQFFFDEGLNDRVHAQDPYITKGQRDMRNEDDGIFREAGPQMVLSAGPSASGYAAAFDLGLDLSDAATGRSDGMGGRGGPGRRGRGRRGGGH